MAFPKFNYLIQMDILIKMEQALIGKESLISLSLKNAIYEKQPASLIIKTTKDMIHDNYNAMADVLGLSLCNTIKTFDL